MLADARSLRPPRHEFRFMPLSLFEFMPQAMIHYAVPFRYYAEPLAYAVPLFEIPIDILHTLLLMRRGFHY